MVTPEKKKRDPILGFFVWLFLGLFGGFAYWSGDKTKAYARMGLWVALIVWVPVGTASMDPETGRMSDFTTFGFLATFLLIFILWVFDLARLLRGDTD